MLIRVLMEKRHLGLLLRIGAMVALLALAVGYSPNPISAGSQEKNVFLLERLWRLSRLHGIFGGQAD